MSDRPESLALEIIARPPAAASFACWNDCSCLLQPVHHLNPAGLAWYSVSRHAYPNDHYFRGSRISQPVSSVAQKRRAKNPEVLYGRFVRGINWEKKSKSQHFANRRFSFIFVVCRPSAPIPSTNTANLWWTREPDCNKRPSKQHPTRLQPRFPAFQPARARSAERGQVR